MFVVVAFFMAVGVPVMGQQQSEKININKASVEELAKLKRVGPKSAAKIIEYREANGPFSKVEDITKVPGIGPKTLEENQGIIVVEP
jgi:competence protein ComEA